MSEVIRWVDHWRDAWWTNPCHRWMASIDNRGYGVRYRRTGSQSVHRQTWIDAFGMPPPETPLVLHRCDVKPCYELTHLWPGTDGDNARDKCRKGRHPQQRKTHCGRCGRPLAQPNLVQWNLIRGRRKCLACAVENGRRQRARRKELHEWLEAQE